MFNESNLIVFDLDVHGAELIEFGHQMRNLVHTVAKFLAEQVVVLVFIGFELSVALLQELDLVL